MLSLCVYYDLHGIDQLWARYLEGDNISTKIGTGRDRDRDGLPTLTNRDRDRGLGWRFNPTFPGVFDLKMAGKMEENPDFSRLFVPKLGKSRVKS